MSVAAAQTVCEIATLSVPVLMAMGAAIGYALARLAHRPRIVPAEIDIEAPDMARNIAEARDALTRFTDRHDPRELKDIGWDLINIVEAVGRADHQLKQAEAMPGSEKEVREALAAVNRLRERVQQTNKRIAQMRSGSWPDE